MKGVPMPYRDLSDTEFVNLIFGEGDRLGLDYIAEAKKRRQSIVPLLCDVLKKEKNYKYDGTDRWWGVVHAVYILGILGDARAIGALLEAGEYGHKYKIDWFWDVMSECFSRIGPAAIPRLKEYIDGIKSLEDHDSHNEQGALWNIWELYPETKKEIEDFFYDIIVSPDTDYTLRAHLIGDFAQINRSDLRPVFEDYFEKGEVELDTFTREDLDYFVNRVNESPAFPYDIEAFYSPEERAKRKERWDKEDERAEDGNVEDYILEYFTRIGRNEQCPCGSGKKFKKCHLPWAEEKRREMKEEEDKEEAMYMHRSAISLERQSESALRRTLASKDLLSIVPQLKEKALEAIKAPDAEFRKKGIMSYIQPVLSQITFENKKELEDFTGIFMDYYNALAYQFLNHPRDEQQIH